ncbi:MAG TPA: enoyl-CoA hydratase-related protein [Thermoanaerobaculia bacterium]|nr:enoyl-CoA hydratase-related protein [Thermoanaerobaculia bacterium]
MAKIRCDTLPDRWRITLTDPPLNILDTEMLEELRDVLGQLGRERPLLVIEAEGEKAFSAGASVEDHVGAKVGPMLDAFHEALRRMTSLDAVTLAKVRGVALGGGCELALACDFVLASERAKLGQPEIALGVFPPVAAYQLSRQIAPRKGLELLLTGDPITATEAERLGMVNAVFPHDGFEASTEEWIGRLLRHSASSLVLAKKAFRLAGASDFEQRLEAVERLYLDELMRTEDANEGLTAFLEKRKPAWKGR